MKQIEKSDDQDQVTAVGQSDADNGSTTQQENRQASGKGWLWVFLLLLIIVALLAAGSWYGWQWLQQQRDGYQQSIDELNRRIDQVATRAELQQLVRPLQDSIGQSDQRMGDLEQGQKALTASTEKLFELYGRDENGWKLAEVEYLLSVAQHKLVLENDFEGAAKTLDAASQRIADLADPGLLPVRVLISEEISQLKTRVRPDLVGMSLLSAGLARQIGGLKPGYKERPTEQSSDDDSADQPTPAQTDQSLIDKARDFIDSLYTIKPRQGQQQQVEQVLAFDVAQKLEDNLKLTRWSILERDAFQYRKLMKQNLDWFKQYYDLENAANANFYESLLRLQRSQIKPDLPDISGSLRLLKQIQIKRADAQQQENDND